MRYRPLLATLAAAACLALTGGCASGSGTQPTPAAGLSTVAVPAQPAGGPPANSVQVNPVAAAAVVITATVHGQSVSPAPGMHQVRLGAPVRITVTADQADELHVHGYDKEAQLSPGQPATVEFVADKPGVFEVELHHADVQLLQLQVS